MTEGGGAGNVRDKMVFEYIKGTGFRVIHADGMIGGVTPQGNLHMAFFTERMSIPKRLAHRLNSDGTLGEAIPEETNNRNCVIREMDVDVIMNLSTAEALVAWLVERIAEMRQAQGTLQSIRREQ